jgi:hypothetical protein
VTDVLHQSFSLGFINASAGNEIRVFIDQVGNLSGPRLAVVVPEPGVQLIVALVLMGIIWRTSIRHAGR